MKQIHANLSPRPRGFTLVELLVVIAIIAILVSLLLPGIQSVREAARRSQCATNVHQLSTAAENYESLHGSLPPGVVDTSGPVASLPQGMDQGWLGALLPYLEQQNVYQHIDREKSVYDPVNKDVRSLTISTFICPSNSDARGDVAYSHYAGLHHDVEAPIDADNHGLFFLNSQVTQDDVTDGLGYTLMSGEKRIDHPLPDLGWLSGTAATLRNTGTRINMTGKNPPGAVTPYVLPENALDTDLPLPADTAGSADDSDADVLLGAAGAAAAADTPPTDAPPSTLSREALFVGGFGSDHPTGANFVFADGHVRFLVQDLDAKILQQLGNRADGQLLDISEVD